MVITFPHLGNTYFAVKTMFDIMQIPYIIPNNNNKSTLLTGSYNSPDEICLPFKIIMGNYIQSIEKGADTILITGSCGPCRFGEYCELSMKILKKMGYNHLKFIVIDPPKSIGIKEFNNRIGQIAEQSKLSNFEKIKALQTAFKILELLDEIDAKAYWLAGFEVNKGECKNLLKKCKSDALSSNDAKKTIETLNNYLTKFDNIEIDKNKNPIKVSIIGEIYTTIEPFTNFYIEEKLMDYGISSKRFLTPSWWVKDMVLKPLGLNSLAINKAANEYVPYKIGGFGRECIGEILVSKKENMDGAIQIFPMGCMPEIVAKSITPTIQKDKDFPIINLIIDEMTGETGYITRVEAFLDMLKMRKDSLVK